MKISLLTFYSFTAMGQPLLFVNFMFRQISNNIIDKTNFPLRMIEQYEMLPPICTKQIAVMKRRDRVIL